MDKVINISKDVFNLKNGLCRCCHSKGSYKSLYTPYFWLDVEEIYSNMLRDCLDIQIIEVTESPLACTICDACIQKLQDAAQFKHQVLKCEKHFRNLCRKGIISAFTKRLKGKHRNKTTKVNTKRKDSIPKKHTELLTNEKDSSQNKEVILYSSKNKEEILYSSNNKEDILYSSKNKEEFLKINKNKEENLNINKNKEEYLNINKNKEEYLNSTKKEYVSIDSKNSIEQFEYNFAAIVNNNSSFEENNDSKRIKKASSSVEILINNNNDDFEYDSDTPISQLPRIAVKKDSFDRENKPQDSYTAPLYRMSRTSKPVSERRRIRVTCDTVLRYTTACPFRHYRSWFRCFYCTENFMDIDKLRHHTLEAHNLEDSTSIKRYPRSLQIDITDFRCKICCGDLTDVQNMVDHFSKIHEKVVYKECIADYKVNTSPYTCHLCKKQYHVFRTLTTHLNEHYANCICDTCGKPFLNTKRLKVHKRTHETGIFPCTKCGKILKTKASKVNHMESHSKRVLKCQICAKTMKHYNERVKHMSEVHNITHSFKCVICGREYKIKHYLATHMRQTHGCKNKKCLECGMAFITNHGLKKHMMGHTGVKSFACEVCKKVYARSHSLKEHMKGHNLNT